MSGLPLLSVIVCSYNRADLLPGCLDSLVGQTLDPVRFEVLVVDNNSTDSTLTVAEGYSGRLPHFRVITEKSLGLSHARNRGWREARGRYVAYIDDDARATPDWCEGVLAAFAKASPAPAAVGGEILPFYETTPPSWFTEEFERRSWGPRARFLSQPYGRYGFSGSNMAFPKDVLEEVGGFSTRFGMLGEGIRMGEDTELFLRLYEKHPRFWYDPQITVLHWVPKRNMTLSYRMLRSFRAGEANAAMERRSILSRGYLACLLDALSLIAALPFRLLARPSSLPTTAVRCCEEFAGKAGYLMARIW